MNHILQLLAVAREENGASPRPVSDADHIALYNVRAIVCRVEGLVEPPSAVG